MDGQTDRHTDAHMTTAYTSLAWHHVVKSDKCFRQEKGWNAWQIIQTSLSNNGRKITL